MSRRFPLLVVALAGCFYVTEKERAERWDLDGDGLERPADCNDDDPGLADEQTFYADTDGDGFGDRGAPIRACSAPEGYTSDDTDCDDTDQSSFPGSTERCDGLDNDCDDQADEGLSDLTWYRDADGDGFGVEEDTVEDCAPPEGYAATAGDCDDTLEDVNPDAAEVCNDLDDDCDEAADEDDPGFVPPTWYPDVDQDGYGDPGPGTEGCDAPPLTIDNDLDCDDSDPAIHPGADELCNGFDDNCDDVIDLDATDMAQYYNDGDGDLYGDALTPVDACDPGTGAPPPGLASNPGDCDDTDADIHPGLSDCQDGGIDNDCDGQVDEDAC